MKEFIFFYIIALTVVVLYIITIIKKYKKHKEIERSKYFYWNQDELKMETWQEFKKNINKKWAYTYLKDAIEINYISGEVIIKRKNKNGEH